MAHSLTLLLAHVVFSTKDRRPWLDESLQPDLFAYLGGIARENQALPLIVNGMTDHVHSLVAYPSSLALADLVRVLKTNSSVWLHREHGKTHHAFAWQSGYGAFSVSHSARAAVIDYIARQQEHHRKLSFSTSSRHCCAATRSSTTSGLCLDD